MAAWWLTQATSQQLIYRSWLSNTTDWRYNWFAQQAPEIRDGRTFLGCDLGPAEMTPRDALRLGTRGSASVLGRARDIGQITPGYCADLALFKMDSLGFAGGAVHDPVGALLLCASAQANHLVVNGRVVVDAGHLTTVDLPVLVEQHNRLAVQLVRSAGA